MKSRPWLIVMIAGAFVASVAILIGAAFGDGRVLLLLPFALVPLIRGIQIATRTDPRGPSEPMAWLPADAGASSSDDASTPSDGSH